MLAALWLVASVRMRAARRMRVMLHHVSELALETLAPRCALSCRWEVCSHFDRL
jgi:hypothetical protein